jgi:hypothetical protein
MMSIPIYVVKGDLLPEIGSRDLFESGTFTGNTAKRELKRRATGCHRLNSEMDQGDGHGR